MFGLAHECTTWLPPHVHHKTRRSQGGNNELTNLVTLCAQAHAMVHNEWAAQAIESGLLHGAEQTHTQYEQRKDEPKRGNNMNQTEPGEL